MLPRKTSQGYLVEPETDREEQALHHDLKGLFLENRSSTQSGCHSATCSRPAGHTQPMEDGGR